MATQSLYRRFRPRKFSELYGQDHVVRALRNAVIGEREGQGYLFSGPRGTGKTTTARILAKVLNCENPVDGEPCCECESCKAVEAGNSYDVLELDAASNNGVNEIRDLIDRAALYSPGRHRVFILDEVHMLSKGAEAALLKTLEEPPEHVVFVLATTDPQKVSETIRSRVQHLQFHLLPIDELEKYVRFVIKEAGLQVDEESIELVLRQGGGSARDTLSALELVVSGGAELEASHTTEELINALVEKDQGRVLAAVAHAMNLGRDPRTFTEDIVRSLRDMFLSTIAPELVQLPSARVTEIAERARSLGRATVVRVMEVLGETLVEMRHAPDARLLLEVAIVKLASPDSGDAVQTLTNRVAALEERIVQLMAGGVTTLPPAPVNPGTGRAKIGGRAVGDRDVTAPTPAPKAPAPVDKEPTPATPTETPSVEPAADDAPAAPPPSRPVTPLPEQDANPADPAQAWPQIVDGLKALAKAIFRPATVDSVENNTVTVRIPANTPMDKAQQHLPTLTAELRKKCGAKFEVVLVKDDTNAVERPAAEKKRTIADEVAEDEFSPVDPQDILPGQVHDDHAVNTLLDAFPTGKVEEAPGKPKKK